MSDNHLPMEVELAYELMPCNALRSAQEPGVPLGHSCAYFRQWGRYHSYDYDADGPPAKKGIVHPARYVGRGPLVPEMLSGCRKAPIMAVGINPNLPGWWPDSRRSVNPLFDDYKQYAHYFRYRTTNKLRMPMADYAAALAGQDDSPLSEFDLSIPKDGEGKQPISVELQPVTMYENYDSLLVDLAKAMGWTDHELSLGEDVSYGNMVACPSAKWITSPTSDKPVMPPMTQAQQRGIVEECFHERKYFLRQLFQSLPAVLMVFSQSAADAFIGEMAGRFSEGDPTVGDKIADLVNREVRLRYGTLADGTVLEARVIFSPHITGSAAAFKEARGKVLTQLVEEAQAGRLRLDPVTKHLERPRGACTFCTTLQIGPCDYKAQLTSIGAGLGPSLLGGTGGAPDAVAEKSTQRELLAKFLAVAPAPIHSKKGLALMGAVVSAPDKSADRGWALSGDPARQQ